MCALDKLLLQGFPVDVLDLGANTASVGASPDIVFARCIVESCCSFIMTFDQPTTPRNYTRSQGTACISEQLLLLGCWPSAQ